MMPHNAEAEYERRLFDLAPVPLIVTTLRGVITEANRAATLLLGRDAFHLEGMPLVEFLPGDERAEFRARLDRLRSTHEMTHWRFRVVRRRDVPLPVSAIVSVTANINRLATSSGLFWCFKTATEEWLPSAMHVADGEPIESSHAG